jgi:hypothetical protein
MKRIIPIVLVGFALFLVSVAQRLSADSTGPVPLVASLPLSDTSGAIHAGSGVSIVDGNQGKALHFDGTAGARADTHSYGKVDQLGTEFTITLWVRPLDIPRLHTYECFITKRTQNSSKPFSIGIGDNRAVVIEGNDGASWSLNMWTDPVLQIGKWSYVALAFRSDDQEVVYVDGRAVGKRTTAGPIASNSEPLVFGADPSTASNYNGDLQNVHIYASALTSAEIAQDMAGTLAVRPAVDADFPPPSQRTTFTLARFDEPTSYSDGYADTHFPAVRQSGPDAVDWPQMTISGKPIFEAGAQEVLNIPLRDGAQAKPLFQQSYDTVVEPGNHWMRALNWIWGQRYVYTTDRSARSWGGVYELWTFPVKITSPAGVTPVSDVHLTYNGKEIYNAAGPFRSLTLLLPQVAAGQSYALQVARSQPVSFKAGLLPVKPGDPEELPIPVNVSISVSGKHFSVSNQDIAPTFHYQKDWDADLAAMTAPLPTLPALPGPVGAVSDMIGRAVPRSPISINAVDLAGGMSGGYYFLGDGHGVTDNFPGTADDYAAYLANVGFDTDVEQTNTDCFRSLNADRSYDRLFSALASHGIKYGLEPDTTYKRNFLSNPNLAFYSFNLPDSHAPLYRDLQLEVQRAGRYGNMLGICLGADNAGYVSYWDWAPPIPNRPYGEALSAFERRDHPAVPVGGENKPAKDYDVPGTAAQFADYIDRYDKTFSQYDYFNRAVASVDPTFILTTGSFGSSPGVGARGGWPWATIPGQAMYQNLPVQQAYDWNENASSMPMHLVAEIDMLKSYYPNKPTWAVVDDFAFLFGREAFERAYALALTRGLTGIGTTFLANPTGPHARPDVISQQKELFAWIHKYGGVYARTAPIATIGILYIKNQALMRPVAGGDTASDDQLLHGSHEGKVTEALFMCHAAGWPARVITPEEMRRGLPPEMKAILLVGLNKVDDTWHWYDGLTATLTKYESGGGRILRDAESVCPVPSAATGMQVRAYVVERDTDWTPELFARNQDNIAELQAAMAGIEHPVAMSADQHVWAMPTQSGNTQYLTVANQNWVDGQNASKVVKPATATISWHTARPIYDVRLGKELSPAEATSCDLTADAFRWYALPFAPVVKPSLSIVRDRSRGAYSASVTITNGKPLTGIPVSVTVAGNDLSSGTVYGATGAAIPLPLCDSSHQGTYKVTATELLTGLSASMSLSVTTPPNHVENVDAVLHTNRHVALHEFAIRTETPVLIALTPEQAKVPVIRSQAAALVKYYAGKKRLARIATVAPGDVVIGEQEFNGPMHYPQWRTGREDLVLFGTPSTNPLMYDEYRAVLLPDDANAPQHGRYLWYVSSPFCGECDVVNIIATDTKEITFAVHDLTGVSAQ